MRLTPWLSAFGNFGFNRRPARRTKNRGVRQAALSLEQLEDRALLTTLHVSLTGDDAAAALDNSLSFRTIQAAITAAALTDDGDDLIQVEAGTYDDSTLDGKISIPDDAELDNLVISGGWNSTFTVQTPQSTIYIPSIAAQTPASGADGDIDVADANTTIGGIYFVFDGDGVGGTGGTRVSGGFVVQATGVTISNNTIEIGGGPGAGARPTGIQTASNDTSDLTITGNTFKSDGTRGGQGIFLNPDAGPNTSLNTLIDGNTFEGANFANMIIVKERGNVTISDNTFERTSAAATFFNGIEVRVGDSATPITNLVITGNTFEGDGDGAGVNAGTGVAVQLGVTQSGTAGTQDITGVVVNNNIIQNHTIGIVVGDYANRVSDISGTINYNSVTGNGTGLLQTAGAGVTDLDATRNWWGAISGPTLAENPGGLGQVITNATGITFAPWLIYSADDDAGTAGVQLPSTITVTSGGDVSAADNDFTRLQNAVGALATGQTLDIQGTFDWTLTNSGAAYLASINTSAANDTRGVVVPGGVDDLTITSTGSTAHIIGQGDLLDGMYDAFLFTADGGVMGNTNLTIENLNVDNFEGAFILGFSLGGTFNGTTIQNNTAHIDGDSEGTQNFGVYLTAGQNQQVLNNVFTFDGDGTSADINGPRSYGFQNTTTGGTAYDGLVIDGNTFQLAASANTSEAVYGVRENSHSDDDNADISITNNSFLGTATQDFPNALMLTSQTAGLIIDGNIFTDVDNVFFSRDGASGTDAGDQFTITNSQLTRVGGADGIFLKNVTTDNITTVINWNINNTIDGFTGVRGLNELSTQATATSRPLTGASDLDAVNAIGDVTTAFVDDNFPVTDRFADPDGIGSGAGPIAVGFNSFTTIADALAGTATGATVVVAEGTYAETPTLSDGKTLQLAGDVTVDSLDSDAGTAVDLQAFTLTVGNDAGDNTLAGEVTGAGNFIKTGTDTLTLTGTNTYTGTTTINNGTLLVNGSITSDVIVNNGGTLGGDGTIDGTVDVNSGGTLSPGNSPGILNTNDLTLVAGSTFDVEVNGTTPGVDADQVVVTGTVDVTGATLSATGTIVSFPGQVVTLIDNDGNADPVVGTFDGLAEGDSVTINGVDFTISYVGGDGNDVTLTETSAVFTIDDVTVDEGAGTLTFTITLDKALDIPVTVTVTFADNTATGGGVDYDSTSQDVVFAAGETSHTVTVSINDDNLIEATEDFFASLSTATPLGGRVVDLTDTGIGSITDNESATVSIAPLNDGAETNAPTNGNFRVTLSAVSTTDTIVNYTVTGTATSGDDFTPLTGSVTIPAGSLQADITIPVLNDDAAEDTETVIVTLTSIAAGGANVTLDPVLANQTATIDITDDDGLEITSGATASIAEGTPASTVVINVDTNDAQGHTVTYALSGPDAALFTIDPATGEVRFNASPDFENPLDQGADNVYNVTVTATADFVPEKVATQDLVITVTDANDNPPVITSVGTDATVPENTSTGTVLLDIDATDADQPAQTLTYSLTGPDAALFAINSDGEITFLASPDYENPLDAGADNVYNITVNVTDSGAPTSTTTQDLTVTVTPVNEAAPVITSVVTSATVPENTTNATVLLDIDATDSDLPAQTLTYTLTGPDAALFNINADGEITFAASPDYENPLDAGADNVYNVTVNVFDNGTPNLSATQDLTVTVTAENDNAPVITSVVTSATIPENTPASTVLINVDATDADLPAQTLTYALSGPDAALFTISADGEVRFAASPDYDNPLDQGGNNVYNVTVTVTDSGSPTLSTTQDLTVTVTPLDDSTPVITSVATASVNENTPASTVVLNVDATDADLPAQNLTYSISGVDAGAFTIDPATGEIRFVNSPDAENPTDDGVNNVYNITVTVTDSGNPTSSTTQDVTITVVPLNDNSPVFSSPATASVAENTAASTVIVNVDATDADIPGQDLTYTLSGPDASLFTINSTTGEVRFAASPDFENPLDQGSDNVYNVTVTATDNGDPNNSAAQDLTITVTSVNDNGPIFVDASPTFDVDENALVGTVVGGVTAADADAPANSLTYSIISGNDNGAFAIDPNTGAITVANPAAINFEVDNQFTLIVRVTDNGSPTPQTADATVVINVNDVEEGPVLTIPNPNGTYHLGSEPAFISPDATFTYDDVSNPNYAGAQVRVSIVAGRGRRDRLSVFRKGDGNNEIDVKGKRIFFNGQLIGKAKGGRGANPDLVVTLTSSATTAAVDNLVRRLNFQAKGDVGTTRTINVQVTNIGGVDSNVATRDIAVVN